MAEELLSDRNDPTLFELLDDRAENVDKTLEPYLTVRKYEQGDYLFEQDDPGDFLVLVRSGAVRIARELSSGTEIDVLTFEAGHIFGEMAFFEPGATRWGHARALQATEVGLIDHESFDELVESEPEFGRAFYEAVIDLLIKRLRGTSQAITSEL